MTDVAEAFKQRATELGITYAQIATNLGISRQSVYRKLNGITDLTLGEAWSIASTLDLDLAKVIRAAA